MIGNLMRKTWTNTGFKWEPVYWKKSTDGMQTWGAQQGPVNTSSGDIYGLSLTPYSPHRMYTTWIDIAPDDLFGDTIDTGNLKVDIKDSNGLSVSSPVVDFSSANTSFFVNNTTATLGSGLQKLRISNGTSNALWTLSLAATSGPTANWSGVYDFNDPTSSGCTDGADADSLGGQLTMDPSGGTLAKGACASCVTTNISKGTSSAFNQGTTDSITLLSAAAGSDDIGDWTLQGVSLSQKIPAEQPAASDYDISFTLTATAL
jgi:hypothetical protein